jgi:hypothetical protein
VDAIDDPAVNRLMTITGVNLTVAAGIVAAIGDIGRFNSPQKLVSYFGLNPRVRQSGLGAAHHGRISKIGRSHASAVLVEAAWAAAKAPGPLHAFFVRIRARRGDFVPNVYASVSGSSAAFGEADQVGDMPLPGLAIDADGLDEDRTVMDVRPFPASAFGARCPANEHPRSVQQKRPARQILRAAASSSRPDISREHRQVLARPHFSRGAKTFTGPAACGAAAGAAKPAGPC